MRSHARDVARLIGQDTPPLRGWDLGDGFVMVVGPNQAVMILEVG